ncbi:MAG: alpha/beta fold hydrolase [Propionibacteriales bacterium]|nr:alpha/beta fold hydrolase [Propionibacteriales bacterium]
MFGLASSLTGAGGTLTGGASRFRRRIMVFALALAMAAMTVPAGLPATAAPPGRGTLHWSPCYKDVGAEFGVTYECAQLNVPLDHDEPAGAQVQLALVRLPARDQDARIGSILLNPGGPGGSGVDFALFFGPFAEFIWGPEVRDRFDLVGFDPRGVGRSIKCFGNERQALEALTPFTFPLTPAEEQIRADGDGLLAEQCDRRGNRIGEHMSTANVARDMDLLRSAVGDEQLTYVGLSYGTYLGVTYANLFPDRVRSVVVDAVLDPHAWANVDGQVPFSTRLRSDQGAQATLDRFFELCEAVAPGNCAFAPNPAQRFDALAQRLLAEPVRFTDPETGEPVAVTYQDMIGETLIGLYDPFEYAAVAELLAVLESVASPGTEASPAKRQRAAQFVNKRGVPHYQNFVESFPAVACSDSNNPTDYAV